MIKFTTYFAVKVIFVIQFQSISDNEISIPETNNTTTNYNNKRVIPYHLFINFCFLYTKTSVPHKQPNIFISYTTVQISVVYFNSFVNIKKKNI